MAQVAPILKKPKLDLDHFFFPKHLSVMSLTNPLIIFLRTIFLTLTSQASRRVTQPRLLFSVSRRVSTLPKLTLYLSAAFGTVNHQILLSTLSGLGVSDSIRSSSPPSQGWASQTLSDPPLHPLRAGRLRLYQILLSTLSGAGRLRLCTLLDCILPGRPLLCLCLHHILLLLASPSSLFHTKSLGSVTSSHVLSYHCYADDTQLISSFPPSDTQVATPISACLADISAWMSAHHLKLNLDKTALLFLPGKACPLKDLSITVDNSKVSSSQIAKNLDVTLDNTLSFSANIKAVPCSCRFMLHNIHRILPYLTQEASQVLIQILVISHLDSHLVFNLPKFSHVTPLLRTLHWLPVEACIHYKTMVLAYGAARTPPNLKIIIILHQHLQLTPLTSFHSDHL
ncbi:uncharacterized protein ACWYII_002362 [Salvelinus alpinus]